MRRALSLAIDRDAITDKVLKTGELPAYGVVPPGTGDYGEPAISPTGPSCSYAERVAEGQVAAKQAGFGPDNPLKLELSYNTSENHKRIAVAIQSMWKQLGVQAELVNREVKVHYDVLKQNQFDIARAAWVADYNDPQNFLYLLETRTGVQNYGRYSNPEFDQLMRAQGQERDPQARVRPHAAGRADRDDRGCLAARSTTTSPRTWSRRRSQGYVTTPSTSIARAGSRIKRVGAADVAPDPARGW